MKNLAILCVLCLASAAPCFSQQFIPTKAQYRQLLKQRNKAFKIQQRISDLQAQALLERQYFVLACRKVAAENGWPTNVECDGQTLMIFQPQPKIVQPPEVGPKSGVQSPDVLKPADKPEDKKP
jgi:hypothetical protein